MGRAQRRVGPIRVLWLIKGLGVGGAERLLVSVARTADHRRFRYDVAYVRPDKTALVGELQAAGVRVSCLSARRRVGCNWAFRLRRLLLEERYNVVHLHSPLIAGIARIIVRTLPADRRPAIVSTEHNSWASYAAGSRWLNALLYRRDDARLAVSADVRASIWARWRAGVQVLRHGLVAEELAVADERAAAVRDQLGARPGDVLALTMANLRHDKGYPDLLAAAQTVLDRGVPVRFVAAGQGPLEAEIRRLHRRSGLGDRFALLGYRSDVADLLAAADLFVLASRHEGLPVALMEALAAGVPAVVTRVGGMPEAVTDGVEGRLVPPGAPQLLAERVVELAADVHLRERMSAAARQRGRQFDISTAVRRIEQIYADVTRSRAPAGRGETKSWAAAARVR